MAIRSARRANFDTLLRAATDDPLALVECRDALTGEPRYVLCAVSQDGGHVQITPFGHLHDGDPYLAYDPPSAEDGRVAP